MSSQIKKPGSQNRIKISSQAGENEKQVCPICGASKEGCKCDRCGREICESQPVR